MDTTSYNRWSRYLHWLVAGLILFTIILGWRHDDHDSLRLTRITLHKSFGLLILLLCFVRIGFRLAYKAPPEPPMPAWQALASKALHIGFYVVMIAMPLTGWLMVSTSSRPVPFFFMEFPHLPVPAGTDGRAFHETFENVHGLIAKLLIYGMIPLHVLAALKHHFVDKDSVMEHMVPGLTPKPVLNWRWLIPLGVVVLAVGLGYGLYRGIPEAVGQRPPVATVGASAGSSSAPTQIDASASASSSEASSSTSAVRTWTVDSAATKISWATSFQGEGINGAFGSFSSQIDFEPDQLEASHVKVSIDLTSVASGDSDRDSTLKSNSFFDTAAFPKAVFEAKRFTRKDATHFVAHGKLTLRGKTQAQDLPFTLTIKDKVATMTATTVVDRTAFGVGIGDYASTDTIPAKITVNIALKARSS